MWQYQLPTLLLRRNTFILRSLSDSLTIETLLSNIIEIGSFLSYLEIGTLTSKWVNLRFISIGLKLIFTGAYISSSYMHKHTGDCKCLVLMLGIVFSASHWLLSKKIGLS